MVREVEVTRRLYRSGESEYLINGEICRLRDVHELLMDTGLGAKAYAIIEQGKIGMILSSRPTDRRQLIEEAAGVTKYRARRRTAELKLEAAQQNLTRIDDIVFEVEKQRGTLKRQAAKARRYRRLRDELRRWEKVLFARRQRVLAQAIAGRPGADRAGAQRRGRRRRAPGRVESDLERLRLEVAQRETVAREARETAHAHEVEIGRLEQRIQSDEGQLTALDRRAGDIAGEIETLIARRGPAADEFAAKQAEAAEAASQRDAAAADLAAAHEAQAAVQGMLDGLEADVEAVRAEQYAAASAATALQHAIENAVNARERVSRDLARLEAEAADLDVEAGRAQADREAATRRPRGRPRPAGRRGRRAHAARRRSRVAARRARSPVADAARARAGTGGGGRAPAVARGVRGRPHGLRRGGAPRAGRVVRRRAADRIGGRLPRGHARLRAGRRGLPRRHPAVRPRARRTKKPAAPWQLVREREAGRCGFVVVGRGRGRRPTPSSRRFCRA